MSSLFEFLKSQISIVDVVSEYVQLKAAGFYMKGSCPFHSEKDASFTVSPDKQIFYCFGCHASGDVIAFIAKSENLSQIQAAKHLIEKYSINLPQELKNTKNLIIENSEEKDSYFAMCKVVALWANKQLLADNFALDYIKSRGISDDSIKDFVIGYFPGGVTKINRFIKDMVKEGVLLKDLLEYGILIEGRSNIYSPFEERILFPIKESTSRFCGFGGRIFKSGDDRPKYYNSRESDGFLKGKLLFAFDLAKKPMQEKGHAFLVEGYMDCIMMVQHGYKNTIATLGTSCTLNHLKMLSRCIKTLYVLYDGDKAGQNAILRLAEFCWEAKLDLRVVQLPEDDDPASLLLKGQSLDDYIQKSLEIFSFFIESLGVNFQQKTLSEKILLAEKIVAVVANINDAFRQDLLLSQAAMVMGLPFESLKNLLGRQKNRKFGFGQFASAVQTSQPADTAEPRSVPVYEQMKPSIDPACSELNLLEERLFSAILNGGLKLQESMRLDEDLIPYFSNGFKQLIVRLYGFVQNCKTSPGNSDLFSSFLDSLDQNEKDLVIKLSMKYDAEISKDSFDQLVFKFCKVNWKYIVQGIKDEMSRAKEMNDTTRLNDLLVKFLKLRDGMQTRGLI